MLSDMETGNAPLPASDPAGYRLRATRFELPPGASFADAVAARVRTDTPAAAPRLPATIESLSEELLASAAARGQRVDLRAAFVPEAMQDLADGRAEDHHRKIAAVAVPADLDTTTVAHPATDHVTDAETKRSA